MPVQWVEGRVPVQWVEGRVPVQGVEGRAPVQGVEGYKGLVGRVQDRACGSACGSAAAELPIMCLSHHGFVAMQDLLRIHS